MSCSKPGLGGTRAKGSGFKLPPGYIWTPDKTKVTRCAFARCL